MVCNLVIEDLCFLCAFASGRYVPDIANRLRPVVVCGKIVFVDSKPLSLRHEYSQEGAVTFMITTRIEPAFAIVRDNSSYIGIEPMFGAWCVH